MNIYLVGGALRDRLLDLQVKDRDWLVVGGTAEEMLQLGYRRADADFPVFLHPETGEEYALARSETKIGPGYKGFDIVSGPEVTLEQDLLRRDLTINALAEDQQGHIIDPFNGREDLESGLLRHVSPAFSEDPVRLLRIARFAAKLGCWGFRVAHSTHQLMKQMAASDDLLALKPERLWQEMVRALGEPQPWRFFEVLHRCGALERLMPELAAALGEPDGHGSEGDAAVIEALKRATAMGDARIRFAVLFYHAVGNGGGEPPLIERLRAERQYTDLLAQLVKLAPLYQGLATTAAAGYWALLQQGRALQQPERFWQSITACEAIWPLLGAPQRNRLQRALAAVATIKASTLEAEGLQGAALGEALSARRLQAIDRAFQERP